MKEKNKRIPSIISISDITENSIFSVENTVLDFGARAKQDIGSLCYLNRSSKKIGGRSIRQVDIDSLSDKRQDKIQAVIKILTDCFNLGGVSRSTLSERTGSFIKFMDWCDNFNHQNVLNDKFLAKNGLRAYIYSLNERVRKNEIKSSYAYSLQKAVITILNDLFNVDDLEEGMNLIIGYRSDTEFTTPQDEADSSRVLTLCTALFEGLTDLVLNNQPYPYKLRIPEILGYQENYLWVLPTNINCMPPHLLSKREEMVRPYWAWDYLNGRVNSLNDISKYFVNKYTAINAIKSAKNNLVKANSDPNHYFRRSRAVTASSSFFQLFLANTGMNLEQAISLNWDDSYEIVKNHQGFRVIKPRAGQKAISFEIQTNFIPAFKKYLLLRKYLLDGDSTDLLFFSQGRTFREKPRKLPDAFTTNFVRTLRGIDPQIPNFGPRQWRANKSDWLLKNVEYTTAASILQNKESTLLRSYSTGSETLAIEEMGTFFKRLTILTKDDNSPAQAIDSAVGGCNNYGHAEPTDDQAIIQPDCEQAEGCLFCHNYFLHSDETDVRKLASCRYCIYQTANLSDSQEHFESVFNPVLKRLEQILDKIKKLGKSRSDMVERVISDVEINGNLSPYWGNKLHMLLELGATAT